MKLIMQFDIDGLTYGDISEIFQRHMRIADSLDNPLSVMPAPGDTNPVHHPFGGHVVEIGKWEIKANYDHYAGEPIEDLGEFTVIDVDGETWVRTDANRWQSPDSAEPMFDDYVIDLDFTIITKGAKR